MPVKSGIHTTSSETLKLTKAVLFYRGSKQAYATINDIIESDDGQQHIGAGVAATAESVGELATLLVNYVSLGGFLPKTVLSVGISSVVWWCPPSTRRLWFKSDKIGCRSAETPQPGLIFSVSEKGWSVWAVKGSKRPNPDTKLYQAPHFNVYKSGAICTGSVICPESSTQESLTAWEEAFFGSFFTHPNVHGKDELVKHKGGAFAFWKMMVEGQHKKFPETALVNLEMTLGDLLKKRLVD